jgi:hypothetical protein
MFFMFVVISPVNKSEAHSTLFSRVQRFTKVIASIAMASGILLILVNRRIGIEIDNKCRRKKITIAVAPMRALVYVILIIERCISSVMVNPRTV